VSAGAAGKDLRTIRLVTGFSPNFGDNFKPNYASLFLSSGNKICASGNRVHASGNIFYALAWFRNANRFHFHGSTIDVYGSLFGPADLTIAESIKNHLKQYLKTI